MASVHALLLSLLLVLTFGTFAFANQNNNCLYTIYVKTGKEEHAGTDSIISLKLYNVNGDVVDINNLVKWGGLMGPNYNYFEIGNLDIFSGRGKCLSPPVCAMSLTSDGSGPNPNWKCNYVEVISTGAYLPCSRQFFKVENWLQPTFNGLTVTRNNCLMHRNGAEFGSKILSSVVALSGKSKR